MHHIKWYARRALTGGFAQPAVAAQFGFVGLFNDSTIGHILRVRWWSCGASTQNIIFATLQTGTPGTKTASGTRIFSGEPIGAGSIYAGSTPTTPTQSTMVCNIQWFGQAMSDLPLFYITPGYTLVFTLNLVNTVTSASFIWEDLEMSMLEKCELE